MARTAVLGLPRIGPDRELKFALENLWAGRTGVEELETTARGLRQAGWERARSAGIDVIASGDFSLYDHVLDTAWALGALPARFGEVDRDDPLAYFGLARGTAEQRPLEMTKWFDTNYHYLVPELADGQRFDAARRALDRAAARGGRARDRDAPGRPRPAQLPAARKGPASGRWRRSKRLCPSTPGCWPSCTRPVRPRSRSTSRAWRSTARPRELDAFAEAFTELAAQPLDLCLATYFAPADPRVLKLPAAELHLDLVRAPEQLGAALRDAPARLSLGVLDGRNVWAADLDLALDRIDAATAELGQRPDHDRAVVLAAARPLRGRARERDRPRDPAVAGVLRREAARAAHARRSGRRGRRAPRRAARRCPRGDQRAAHLDR